MFLKKVDSLELLKLFLKFVNLIDEFFVLFDDFLLFFLVDPILEGVIGSEGSAGNGTAASNFVEFLDLVFEVGKVFE